MPIKNYSSGMHMRLGFAIAANLDPDILLLDEIFAVGDADFQQRCIATMDAFMAEGKTIIFVSHALSSIRTICGRVCVLEKGELAFDGEIEDGLGLLPATARASGRLARRPAVLAAIEPGIARDRVHDRIHAPGSCSDLPADPVRLGTSPTDCHTSPSSSARFLYRPIVFREPERVVHPPSWLEHIPFAFWAGRRDAADGVRGAWDTLRQQLRGLRPGRSQMLELTTAAYAVDTWKGDAHAGFYDESVFTEWAAYHDRHFSAFSRLVRSDLRGSGPAFRGRQRGPAAHRRLPHLRGGRRGFRAVAAEAQSSRRRAVPRHQRARGRLRRLAAVGRAEPVIRRSSSCMATAWACFGGDQPARAGAVAAHEVARSSE